MIRRLVSRRAGVLCIALLMTVAGQREGGILKRRRATPERARPTTR